VKHVVENNNFIRNLFFIYRAGNIPYAIYIFEMKEFMMWSYEKKVVSIYTKNDIGTVAGVVGERPFLMRFCVSNDPSTN
jgi:hypothetical protein